MRGLVAALTVAPVLKELVFAREQSFQPVSAIADMEWKSYTSHMTWCKEEVVLNGAPMVLREFRNDIHRRGIYMPPEAWPTK